MVVQNFAYLNKAQTFLGANGTHMFPPHLNLPSGFDFPHYTTSRCPEGVEATSQWGKRPVPERGLSLWNIQSV